MQFEDTFLGNPGAWPAVWFASDRDLHAATLSPGTVIAGESIQTGLNAGQIDTQLVAIDPTTGTSTVISSDAIGTGPSLNFGSPGTAIEYITQQSDGSLLVVDDSQNVIFGGPAALFRVTRISRRSEHRQPHAAARYHQHEPWGRNHRRAASRRQHLSGLGQWLRNAQCHHRGYDPISRERRCVTWYKRRFWFRQHGQRDLRWVFCGSELSLPDQCLDGAASSVSRVPNSRQRPHNRAA